MGRLKLFSFVLIVLVVTMMFGTTGVNADTPTEHILECEYNATDGTVDVNLFVSKGTAIVGYCSIDYDESSLVLCDKNLSVLPETIPTQGSYIKDVVSASNNIVITNVGITSDKLINTDKGYVLFAWFLPESSSFIDASDGKVNIATLRFKLKDGKTMGDLSETCVDYAKEDVTSSVQGWYPGVLAMSNDKVQYSYSPGNKSNNTTATVVFNFDVDSDANSDTNSDTNTDTDIDTDTENDTDNENETPADTSTDVEDSEDTQTEQETDIKDTETETEPTDTEPITNPDVQTQNMKLVFTPNTDSIKVKWEIQENVKADSFSVKLFDIYGNAVRSIEGISPVSRSCTIDELASNYKFKMQVCAVDTSSKTVAMAEGEVSTKETLYPKVVSFAVTYDALEGYIYGFDMEFVMFGQKVTKIPQIIAPEGLYFAGWSKDRRTFFDLENANIYEDVTVYALYTDKKVSATVDTYITGYADKTFKPEGKINRAELAALAARLCGKFDANADYENNFSDVADDSWFKNYVGACVKNGIITGYEDGTFKPSAYVTRGEFAAIVCRIYGFEYTGERTYYSDIANHWANKYINALCEAKATDVKANSLFRPDDKLTRTEAVVILNAAQGRKPDKNAIDEYVEKYGSPFGDVEIPNNSFYEIFEAAVDYR